MTLDLPALRLFVEISGHEGAITANVTKTLAVTLERPPSIAGAGATLCP
jgi:hypothetical protein